MINTTQNIATKHHLEHSLKANISCFQMNYYDNNGVWQQTRHIGWTEDNRLHTAVDNIYYSYYVYDHTGERTLKLTGKNSFVDVNGETQATATLENATLYVGPYLVATNQGYTKHYYNGTERICAKLGNGGLGNGLLNNPNHSAVANGLFTQCQTAMKEQTAKEEDQMCISSVSGEWNSEMRLEGYKDKFSPVQPNLQPKTSVNVSTFRNTLSSYSSATSSLENNIYFYHGDHLGSASWITNGSGTPVQHLQYMPYGEPFINERISSSSYEERYTFTGKERDSETGYSYFGARFYDSDLMTGWLSVDPMADSIPYASPYIYCLDNPIKLKDPNGEIPLETIWDIGNVLYDFGAAVTNHIKGDHEAAKSNWCDLALDAAATLTPYVPAGLSKLKTTVKSFDSSKLKYIKSSNGKWSSTKYRQNLQKYTGKEGVGYHAHHTLPKEQYLRKYFEAVGLDVNDPANMVWREGVEHIHQSQKHLAAWRGFFEKNPNATKEQILKFRDIIEKNIWGNTKGDL